MFEHAVLPGLTILITSIGGWILTMRNNVITVMADDYVRTARAKGLKPWRIMWAYAGRNAILPNLTGFAMSLGFVVSGAIVVEYVFNYPGLGTLLLTAVQGLDYPLMQALFLLITVAVLLSVLGADVVTAILDPRTRAGGLARPQPMMNRQGRSEATGERSAGSCAPCCGTARGPRARSCCCSSWCWPSFPVRSRRTARRTSASRGPSDRPARTGSARPPRARTSSRSSSGARAQSLIIAVAAGGLATLIAVLVGVSAAYLGGITDGVLSLITDVLLVIPILPLIIVIAAYLRSAGLTDIIIVLGALGWSYGARQLRVAGALAAEPGLPHRGERPRGTQALHHRGRDHAHADLAHRGDVPRIGRIRGPHGGRPAVRRPR